MSDILGFYIGNYHTWTDWKLYLNGPASISLPIPQTNYVKVPGKDGYLDLSTALTGEVIYETREFSASLMSMASPEEWPALYSKILNAIHGQRMKIILDEDPDYYYSGRFAVESPTYSGDVWSFSITGVLYPYKLKVDETEITGSLTTTAASITLENDRMPVVPEITVSKETTLTWGSNTYKVSAGTHKILDIMLVQGTNTIKAKTTSGTGTITITYQEGSL